ncbi:type II toxin-antitoxin system VapC family toxin [Candidatus Curtissbacteria bacterium]|nr:type II toxin-antitoxin system VapC family toxin [Candidatus Curtissbacteria bacterium]
MRLVIDSSILIDYLRGGIIAKQLFDAIEKQNHELFIPTIVIFELFSGTSTNNPLVRRTIMNLISDFERIELTEEIAIRAGELYRQTGKHISPQDYIIAASALEIGGTVVTLNKKHFKEIPHLRIW